MDNVILRQVSQDDAPIQQDACLTPLVPQRPEGIQAPAQVIQGLPPAVPPRQHATHPVEQRRTPPGVFEPLRKGKRRLVYLISLFQVREPLIGAPDRHQHVEVSRIIFPEQAETPAGLQGLFNLTELLLRRQGFGQGCLEEFLDPRLPLEVGQALDQSVDIAMLRQPRSPFYGAGHRAPTAWPILFHRSVPGPISPG